DVILLPEIPYDIQKVAEKIQERYLGGRGFAIVVVAEGAKPKGGQHLVIEKKAGQAERLGGAGARVAEEIVHLTKRDTRVVVLGHLLRGGSPTTLRRLSVPRCGASGPRRRQGGRDGGARPAPGPLRPAARGPRPPEAGPGRLRHHPHRPRDRDLPGGLKDA